MRLALAALALLALLAMCEAKQPRTIKPKRCNARKDDCSIDITELGDIDASPPDEIDVQLAIDGKARKFKKARGSKDGKAWVGQDGNSTINLLKTKNNRIVGSVVDVDEATICSIGVDSDGSPSTICHPSADFPPEGEPEGGHMATPPDDRRDIEAAEATARRAAGDAVVDVMVLWTRRAECKNVNMVSGCTPSTLTTQSIEDKIELAVEETNVAFTASGINVQLKLVHAYRTNWEEGANAFNVGLGALQSRTDGIMDDAHAKRVQYGADVVVLIIDDPQYCGLGYLGPSSNWMFSVTSVTCATGYYSFGHEIGHNFGLNHDRGTSGACTASGYNYGYRAPTAAWRTILAYNCAPGQCDNMPKSGCPRIQRFSTPRVNYGGLPLGTAANDNARKMNDGGALVSNYFPSAAPQCVTNSDCNDGNTCTTDTCDGGRCKNVAMLCDDGNGCTADSCSNGKCVFSPISCNDNNPCTVDTCSASLGGCIHMPRACSDNNECTLDSCSPSTGACLHTVRSCNDGNPCTVDSCDLATGCKHTPIAGCACNKNLVCEDGEDQTNCPSDCGPWSESAAVSGNGICEMGDGETCRNSIDCMRNKRGQSTYCCGEGAAKCGTYNCGTEGLSCLSTPNTLTGYCGDGKCNFVETWVRCKRDCSSTDATPEPEPLCNYDGLCDEGETCEECKDCLPTCGNGICEIGDGETCSNCPSDCKSNNEGRKSDRYCCGISVGCSDPRCSDRGCSTSPVCPPMDLERAITVGAVVASAGAPSDVASAEAPSVHTEMQEDAVSKANTAMLVAVGAASAVAILSIVVASVVVVNMRWRRHNQDIEGHPNAAKKMEMLLADSQTYASGGYTVQSSMQMKPVWSEPAADGVISESLQRKTSLKNAPPLDTTLFETSLPNPQADHGARLRPTPKNAAASPFDDHSPKYNDGKLVTPTGKNQLQTPKGQKQY
mmetsp:Transcript_32860/g.80619  ORF Transcript_32860/g.80619 Transcript_32860/m.80619 type:complete len:947 (+) Transcript_32860:146-2986(+)